jgi:hypothetical protein
MSPVQTAGEQNDMLKRPLSYFTIFLNLVSAPVTLVDIMDGLFEMITYATAIPLCLKPIAQALNSMYERTSP